MRLQITKRQIKKISSICLDALWYVLIGLTVLYTVCAALVVLPIAFALFGFGALIEWIARLGGKTYVRISRKSNSSSDCSISIVGSTEQGKCLTMEGEENVN